MVHHSNKNIRIWLSAFAATHSVIGIHGPLRSPNVLTEIKFTVLPLDFKPAWLFPQPQMNLRYSYPSALYYSFFRAFSEDCAHSKIYLPVSLRMNCVLAANFLWAALVLYFPPRRWPPRYTSASVLPMSLHSCLRIDVVLITPCRVMLINIINVLKCTLVYWKTVHASWSLCIIILICYVLYNLLMVQ